MSGIPYVQDLCAYVGDSTTFDFLWETVDIVDGLSTKTPVDLTGGEMWIAFSKDLGTMLLTKQSEVLTDPTDGTFSFTLTPDESRTLLDTAYCKRVLKYDIEFRGNVATPPITYTTLLKGSLTLSADVTRTP